MTPELFDYLEKLFPSIDPYVSERAKESMQQFKGIYGAALVRLCDGSLDYLQGDIYSEIPFVYLSEDGEYKVILRKGFFLLALKSFKRLAKTPLMFPFIF